MKPGTILLTEDAKPIQGVDMSPQALAHLDRYMMSWQNQVDRATGTFAVSTGETLPSGTPYRLGAILDQNAQSQFDLRREELGILLNRIWRERVIPFHIKQIKRKNELNLKFTADQLRQIDQEIETRIADDTVLKNYFAGAYDQVPPLMRFEAMRADREAVIQGLDMELKKGKSRRKIKNDMGDKWKEYWDDAQSKVFTEVTNESRKKGVLLETINNVLIQYLQYKPQLDADPEARRLFNDIVQIAGLNPVDFTNSTPAQPQQPGAPGQPMQNTEEPVVQTAKPN
jgi:hypothetical protein